MKSHIKLTGAIIIFALCTGGFSFAGEKKHGEPLDEGSESSDIVIARHFDSPFMEGRAGKDEKTQVYRSFIGTYGHDAGGRGFKSRLMIMWNLVDYLDLDEDTAAVFFPIFNEHNQKRDKLTDAHRELVEQIVGDVEDENVSTGELKGLIDKLEETDGQIRQERKAFLEKAKKILDDRQYVKLVIFNDKLKKDLFNRFSARRFGVRAPVISGFEILDATDVQQTGANRKNLEQMMKLLEKQQKEIEIKQEKIEKLLKE